MERKGNPINTTHFRDFALNHQALLYPAFVMQSALRRKILGSGFWERQTEKRMRITKGKYVPVRDFLVNVSEHY